MATTYDTSIIRKQESFNFAREVSGAYGELDKILEWCKRELAGEWRWQLITVSSQLTTGRYIFYFDESQDYFVFTLRWA